MTEAQDFLAERVANDFKFHPATEDTAPKYEAVRGHCRDLATLLMSLTPVSREQSLALTKLEEAMFWANAAIAREGEQE